MKSYKKVKVEAVNAPRGSYAAGCPQYQSNVGYNGNRPAGDPANGCANCECTK